MNESEQERVMPVTRYNCYKYYNDRKHQYKLGRELREKKKKLEEDSKEHYKQFWDSFLIRTSIDISPLTHK
tara:strand:- start:139 stop:351 length:213 start_codon:yes stop_codon:yes gene_type:complete